MQICPDVAFAIKICHYTSPLGGLTLAGTEGALTGLWFDGQAHFGATLTASCEEGWLPVFDDAFRWLDSYFGGYVPGFTPQLCLSGTPFRQAVWQALMDIPYGETISYGALAAKLGPRFSPASPRAVGGAVGHNPISLIIPCHRVLGADGRLTGYAAGLDRKARLLQLERTGSF